LTGDGLLTRYSHFLPSLSFVQVLVNVSMYMYSFVPVTPKPQQQGALDEATVVGYDKHPLEKV
jgi:hypothetical protein